MVTPKRHLKMLIRFAITIEESRKVEKMKRKRNLKNFTKSDNAVSEILGTVILLAMAVALFSVLYVLVTSSLVTTPSPSASLVGYVEGQSVIIEHLGGDSLDNDPTNIVVTIGGAKWSVSVETYLDDSNGNNKWDIGERLVYPAGDITGLQVETVVVDCASNSALFIGILQDGETVAIPIITTVDATDITNISANLWMNYKFRNYSGSVRFAYKQSGGSWTNTSWESKSGPGSYNTTVSGLSNDTLYYFKAQLMYNSTLIEGEEKNFTPQVTLSTHIDTIAPYRTTMSPLTITGNGNSALDNVTLWYRYSTDNSTWGADPNWWNNNWNYYRTITIDHTKVDENLINLPVLIKISSTIGAKCDNGDSIRFVGTDNSTEYYYEIEKWDSSGDSYVWVNITSVSSTVDTAFLMYYNNSGASDNQNPSNVWDSNYKMVQHMKDYPDTSHIRDSTSNNNDGTKKATNEPVEVTGQIDQGQDFDGNDYIELNSSKLPTAYPITVSMWVKPDNNNCGVMYYQHNPASEQAFGFHNNLLLVGSNYGSNYGLTNIDAKVNIGEWNYLVVSFISSNAVEFYINSIRYNSEVSGNCWSLSGTKSALGVRYNSRYYYGVMDEVRILNTAGNTSWINASFQNQNDTASFLTIGSEQSSSGGINWTSFNADTSSPWQWSFNFTNGTGYYEFYSIGMCNGDAEDAPSGADTMCYYNALVGTWHFNENSGTTAYDSSGDNDGAIHGASWITGIDGSGLDFDGTDDYVSVSDDNSLDLTDELTISAWILAEDTSVYNSIVTKGNPHSSGDGLLNYGLQFPSNSKLRFFSYSSGYSWIDSTGTVTTDEWTYVAVTFDRGSVAFYINGAPAGGGPYASSTLPTSSHPLYIGQQIHATAGSGQFFDGNIDEVSIDNKALTAEEILASYNTTKAGRIAQWHLDENTGTTAYDLIGGNDGAINGASWTTGVSGSGLSFDGSNDFVSASIGTLNAPFTVEAWGYFDNLNQPSGNYDYILMIGTGANMISFSRNESDDRFYSWCENEQKLGPVLTGQQWLHIVSVYRTSPPYHSLYINGQSQTVDQPSAAVQTNGELSLGKYESGSHWMDGTIDEVAIYNRVLSSAEILNHYNDLKP